MKPRSTGMSLNFYIFMTFFIDLISFVSNKWMKYLNKSTVIEKSYVNRANAKKKIWALSLIWFPMCCLFLAYFIHLASTLTFQNWQAYMYLNSATSFFLIVG